jgi:hypothetical protein
MIQYCMYISNDHEKEVDDYCSLLFKVASKGEHWEKAILYIQYVVCLLLLVRQQETDLVSVRSQPATPPRHTGAGQK